MNRTTQLALLDRIEAHLVERTTDTAAATMSVPVTDYTGRDHWERERTAIGRLAHLVALSGLIAEPGSYAELDVAGRPVVLTRTDDGVAHALLNVCRHRGAPVAQGCGTARRLTCQYHGWSYHLDGRSASRRGGEYFDGVETAGLTELPILERGGYIWVNPDPSAGPIATSGDGEDDVFGGAFDELAGYNPASFRHFASTTFTRPINWKLAIDTFAEAWHVPVLHRDSLAALIRGDASIFDAFGPHGRMIASRRSIDAADRDSPNPLLAHATTLYFMLPSTVLIFQQDHFQLYRNSPGSTPDEAVLDVSLYVPDTRDDEYWRRNFDLLVDVTDAEDFTIAATMQRGFHSGAQTHVTYGTNEPALQHVHRSLTDLIG